MLYGDGSGSALLPGVFVDGCDTEEYADAVAGRLLEVDLCGVADESDVGNLFPRGKKKKYCLPEPWRIWQGKFICRMARGVME